MRLNWEAFLEQSKITNQSSLRRLWDRLTAPHSSIVDVTQRRTVHLLQQLMLWHFICVFFAILILNSIYINIANQTIWDDLDLHVIVVGLVVVSISYLLTRSGRIRSGTNLYYLICLIIPLIAPFMPDPDAEIGIMTTSIIAMVVAMILYDSRGLIWTVLTIAIVATVELSVVPIPPSKVGTGFAIIIALVVGGILFAVYRKYLEVLEHDRLTQLRASTVKIRDREEQYRLLTENITDVVWRMNLDLELVYVSPVCFKVFGFTPEELLGQSMSLYSPPESVEKAGTLIEERLALIQQDPSPENQSLLFELELQRKDGTRLISEVSTQFILDSKNKVIGINGVTRDVTSRKKIEEALRSSEEKFSKAFEISPEAISIASMADGRYLFVNDAFLRKTEYAREEVIGHTSVELNMWVDSSDRARYIQLLQCDGSISNFECCYRMKKGDIRNFHVSSTIMKINGLDCSLNFIHDFTERKQYEEAQRASEHQFSTIFDLAPIGMALISLEGKWIRVNQRICNILGYTEDELFEKTFAEITHPDDVGDNVDTFKRMIAGELDYYQVEKRYFHKSGRIVWVLLKTILMRDTNGKPLYFLSQTVDMTSRKQAEQALVSRERLFRAIIENSSEAYVLIDRQGKVSYESPNVSMLTGYTVEERIGKSTLELIYHEDLPHVQATLVNLIQNPGMLQHEIQYRSVRKDGSVWWAEAVAINQLDDPDVNAIVVNYRDITERKMIEDVQKENEERYRMLVELSPDSILIHSEGVIELVNQAAVVAFGADSASELIGTRIIELVHPDYRNIVVNRIRNVESSHLNAPRIEELLLRLDGSSFFAEVAAIPFTFRGKPAVQVIAQDITQRKQAEAERERLRLELLQAQKMEVVGRLAGGVAHDFNNMLGVIIGHTELVSAMLPANDPMLADLNEIRNAANRSASLTRQLLAFARKQTAIPQVLDWNNSIAEMTKMMQRLIGEDIHLIFDLQPSLWKVYLDPGQVDQLLTNLLVNGRDAIEGVGTITVRTMNFETKRVERLPGGTELGVGQYVRISVSDTGSGIAPENLVHVFEPFFTTKKVGKGTGLGLATVDGIVKQNLGSISVCSKVGEGTIFDLYFPRYVEASVPTTEQKSAAAKQHATGTETILLVEDEPAILQLCESLLKTLGYQVSAHRNPLSALDSVKTITKPYDLLITDVVMPGMSGKELSDKITQQRAVLKTLFMSGYTADEIASRGVLEEGLNFIHKPFNMTEFSRKVRSVLDENKTT